MTSPPPPALSTTLDDLSLLQTTQQTQLAPTGPTRIDLLSFPLDFGTLLPLLDFDGQGLDVDPASLEMFNQASYAHYQPPPAPLNPLPPAQQQQSVPNGQQPAGGGGGGAGSGVGQFSFGAFSQPTQQQGFYGGNQKQPSMAMGFPGGVNGGFVGSQAGDFELFGGGGGPSPVQSTFATPAYNPYAVPSMQQHAAPPPPYPVPIPPSPASTSSISGSAQNSLSDYPPLPDLIPDAGSPASGHSQNGSPPSPRRFSLSSQSSSNGGGGFSSGTNGGAGAFSFARPPFLSAAAAGAMGKGGSFRTALGVSPSSSASSFGSFGSFGAGIERPASVPIPEAPRPVRRKTQERRDWPSFYSSGSSASSSSSGSAYMPFAPSAQVTDEPASYATPTLPSHQQQRATPFDPSSSAALNFSLSPSPAYPHHQQYASSSLPHTDHPLLPSEQTDLLERVRRDLLELSDVDLSSIKGPLRALALSGTDRDATPTPSSVAAQLTPKTGLLRSPAAQALRDEDTLSAGTVSPQEAFLDYPSVDSRLHDPRDPLFIGSHGERGEFGVGVGASLFAPLPGQQQPSKPVLPPPAPATSSSSSPKTAPPATASPRESHRRGPHPFSVPQNAVTWAQQRSQSGHHWLGGVVDGDADDDDGDFSASAKEEEGESDEGKERREEEVRERARLGEGFGRFRKEEADLRGLKRGEEEGLRVKNEEEEVYGVKKSGEEEDKEGTPRAEGMVSGKTPAFAPPLPPHQQQQNQAFTFAPPLSLSQPSQQSAIPQSLTLQQQSLLAAACAAHQNAARSSSSSAVGSAVPPSLLPALPLSQGDASGTTTPRRTAAASALAGLGGTPTNTFASPAPAPNAAPSSSFIPPLPPSSESTRPQRQRKRSRIARAAYGDDSGEEGGGGEDAADGDFVAPPPSTASSSAGAHDGDGHESDGSYRSSASSFSASAPSSHRRRTNTSSSAAPPPKRRRRAPPASSSSSAAAGPNAIRCDHSNADGTVCGVAFRRPYDLARHKETIHGEGLGGEKLARAKEWRCEQCGGTFSRKDALLRHGRIRGHVTGA